MGLSFLIIVHRAYLNVFLAGSQINRLTTFFTDRNQSIQIHPKVALPASEKQSTEPADASLSAQVERLSLAAGLHPRCWSVLTVIS